MLLANSTRIPLNCLQEIWNKATELLGTDKAIVTSSDCDTEATYVLSYSESNPYLVTPKKTEVFAYDSACVNWKCLGICAHSVAVAEMNGRLQDFTERVKNTHAIRCYNA